MEGLLKKIETKRILIQSTPKTLKQALDSQNVTSAERQKNTIREVADEIYELRVSVQESCIEKGDDDEEIKTWTDSIDNELGTWDNEITNASKTINTWKEQEDEQAKLHKEEIEAKARQDLFKEQLEFDQEKMKQRMEHELKMDKIRKENKKQRQTNAKLPKLVITKFNGAPLDWLRFWNQFEAEIDKADVAAITKFSYLKELVDPKVRLTDCHLQPKATSARRIY